MNDPYLAGAAALKRARDCGMIDGVQYDEMYAALAKAAEQDARSCDVIGCTRAAYIGTKCAHHTSIEDVRRKVQEVRHAR